jgi:hypothetical protein
MISLTATQLGKRKSSPLFVCAAAAVLVLISFTSLNAQTRKVAAAPSTTDELIVFKDYRGIQLGMTADEVRKKLGDPKDKGEEQDFFMFSDSETAQIVYDKTHKVVAISADFMNPGNSVPTAKQVFGSDVEAKADGSLYRLVRYTKAGFWVSYSRTAGDAPLTTVTLQKIQ